MVANYFYFVLGAGQTQTFESNSKCFGVFAETTNKKVASLVPQSPFEKYGHRIKEFFLPSGVRVSLNNNY